MDDDGFNNSKINSGAVYLYSFTDPLFNDLILQALLEMDTLVEKILISPLIVTMDLAGKSR